MILRPYQDAAISALWAHWAKNPHASPLIVAPTGSGKSCLIAAVIQQISVKRPQFRFLVVTHTKEIVSQNAKELQQLLPKEPIGIYSAGLMQKTIRRITFANVQSLYKRTGIHADFLLIDECHLVSQHDTSMYQTLIANLQKQNYQIRIMGFSATPFRMDQGSLIADGSTFSDIAYDISIRELIDQGFLCPLISMQKTAVDLSGVKMSGYDYNQGDLQDAFNREALIDLHCREVIKAAGDRKHWLVFCAGIEHAEQVASRFKALGITADYVTGEMMNMNRDQKLRDFQSGKTRALCNVNVLTTGFNYRDIDLIVLLRATKSCGLYVQMVGRGTRSAEGKKDCMVLDFGGNIERHGPIDMIQVKTNRKKKAEISVAPHKVCPMCGCVVAIRVSVCPSCEYPFPDNTKELEIKAATVPILSEIEELAVETVEVKRHKKDGKPDSLKVEYYSGNRLTMEFLCFEHGGFPAQKAAQTWINRGAGLPIPKTVAEALKRKDELQCVVSIRVIPDGKYRRILSVKLGPKESPEVVQARWEEANPW